MSRGLEAGRIEDCRVRATAVYEQHESWGRGPTQGMGWRVWRPRGVAPFEGSLRRTHVLTNSRFVGGTFVEPAWRVTRSLLVAVVRDDAGEDHLVPLRDLPRTPLPYKERRPT